MAETKESHNEFHKADPDASAPLTAQPKKQDGDSAEAKLGYKPALVHCPRCNRDVTTSLTFHITDFTHLVVFLCSVATWPCMACFVSGVPYCLTPCQKVDHRCPHCKYLIGKHAQFRLSKIFGCKKSPAGAVIDA